jgi:hypothetical protein
MKTPETTQAELSFTTKEFLELQLMVEELKLSTAKERKGESVLPWNGTPKIVKAALISEHPIIASVAQVIKEGPKRAYLSPEDDNYWLQRNWTPEQIQRMREFLPPLEGESLNGTEFIDDYSQGTGLRMMGLNLRTGKVALAGFNFPGTDSEETIYDLGFLINYRSDRQLVDVRIHPRGDLDAPQAGSEAIANLPHLRAIK